MNMRTLLIGERVRIHPASSWFMRGVTHAVVTSKHNIGGDTLYYLRNDTASVKVKASYRIKLYRRDILAEGE